MSRRGLLLKAQKKGSRPLLDSQGGEGFPLWLESDWIHAIFDSVQDRLIKRFSGFTRFRISLRAFVSSHDPQSQTPVQVHLKNVVSRGLQQNRFGS